MSSRMSQSRVVDRDRKSARVPDTGERCREAMDVMQMGSSTQLRRRNDMKYHVYVQVVESRYMYTA